MSQRASNIELLRIVSMFLIVLHHICIHGPWPSEGVLANDIVIDILSFGGKLGVDCFVLITGYFMVSSRFKLLSVLKVWFSTLCYAWLFLLIFLLFDNDHVTLAMVAKSLFPVCSSLYWFVTCYIAVYFLSPLLNLVIHRSTSKQRIIIFFAGAISLSFIPTISTWNPLASNLIWFIFLYYTGAFCRICNVLQLIARKVSHAKLIIWFGVFIAFVVICVYAVIANYMMQVGAEDLDPRYLMKQNSLPIFIMAVGFLLGFSGINLGVKPFLNTISSCTFGVYLIHDNYFIRNHLWDYFSFLYSFPPIGLLIACIVLGIVVFFACSLIEYMRLAIVEKPLFAFLKTKFGEYFNRIDLIFSEPQITTDSKG